MEPICQLSEKVFSNEDIKPSRFSEHLTIMHSDKVDKNLAYFQSLRKKISDTENHWKYVC